MRRDSEHMAYLLEHLWRYPSMGVQSMHCSFASALPLKETSKTCTLGQVTELTNEELAEEVL
jgi:hypothetical protein